MDWGSERKGGRKKVGEAMASERAEPPQKQRKKEKKSTSFSAEDGDNACSQNVLLSIRKWNIYSWSATFIMVA